MKDTWDKLFPDATLNLVEYLVDGARTFESYVEAIETAKSSEHYIYILGWMLDVNFPLTGTFNPVSKSGQTYFKGTKTLLKLLETAANKGVEIRVLVWHNLLYLVKNKQSFEALSKLPNTKIFIDDFTFTPAETKKIIAQVEPTIKELLKKAEPILMKNAAVLEKFYEEEFDGLKLKEILDDLKYRLDRKNVGAHHEKILIVKGDQGLISFCGGIDINSNRFSAYHDTACRIMGPEAHQVLKKFVLRWLNNKDAASTPLRGIIDLKPSTLPPVVGDILSAKLVGTYNSPDGKIKDRSIKEAYLKIIANARNYIYIEDQYLVNLDVANALNKKIKDYWFKILIIVIQDSRETTDIMIADRKRGEFYKAVIQNTSQEEKRKVSLFMLNDDLAKSRHRHPGLHSKTLIVDDELAIIGSTNVNQRSFTLDSESSLIVFNGTDNYYRDNFAYKFRHSLWRDFILKDSGMSQITWEEFVRNVNSVDEYSLLRNYMNNIQDLDIRLIDGIRPLTVPISYAITQVYKDDLSKAVLTVSIVNSPVAIKQIFDVIWEHIIDPIVK